ncbi:endolytic transglycosylase MltG [Marinobacter lipolyticus]|mgnify:CR=1 FL=1|uniref:endolytic transglycosylase MltG n=1 Tax=Marinobacter lipolyticus TaxID=209639 RepID=UPI001BCF1A88|nr:endolytic transglycosylase MltG [Marinobacter lipolyticus]MBS8241839.1 endolytic transglycosylase MltG [Marinobacter lipolyticus]
MIRKLLISIVCIAVLLGSAGMLWVWQGLKTLEQPVVLQEPVLFDVPEGASFGRVARQLEAEGFVGDSLWLRIHGRLNPGDARVKAGEYEFTSGMSARDILDKMVAGEIKHWSIQFIEGWTFRDMRQALANSERLTRETTDWSDEDIMAAVGAEGEHPEGRFFPDTYAFTSSETDLSLLRRAFQRMETVLAAEWENRAEGLPYDSPYEALIMASIVERETGAPHERGEVAGVFVRRLEKGMRLQTDPTVIYGMGDRYVGRITRKDLQRHTPYNTYRIDGLPPTPIALPGQDAIHAALNPEEGDSLYFVARGDGTHKFSRTLSEHQQAVREFQLNRRSDYRSSPAPVVDGDNQ